MDADTIVIKRTGPSNFELCDQSFIITSDHINQIHQDEMIKPFFCSHLAVALEPFGAVATLAILIVRATVAVVEL